MSLHIGTKTRAKLPSDLIVREPEPEMSREEVTVLAGSGTDRALELGTVYAKTAAGKVVQLDHTAVDGTENAVGVMITNTTAPVGSDARGVGIERLAKLRAESLIWPAGIGAPAKAAAIAALEAKLIIIR